MSICLSLCQMKGLFPGSDDYTDMVAKQLTVFHTSVKESGPVIQNCFASLVTNYYYWNIDK